MEPTKTLSPANKRNSNIEFLRILAMFMVLMLHVNFLSLGHPTHQQCITSPFPTFLRVFFELSCIISVNLFVFISGWFGINVKLRGFCKFIFQCVFILTITTLIGLIFGFASFTNQLIIGVGFGYAWFIIAYMFLYILSPLLNSFCNNNSEKAIRYFLICFYLLQTIYGNVLGFTSYCTNGYSAFSFIGLYILAQYCRKYGKPLYKYGLFIYVISTILLVLMYYIPLLFNTMNILPIMAMRYTCPFNITATMGLVMWVAGMRPKHNKFINFVAASAFSVYLFHVCTKWTEIEYKKISLSIYDSHSGIYYLFYIFIFMIGVYFVSILIDQLRKFIWNKIAKYIPDKIII